MDGAYSYWGFNGLMSSTRLYDHALTTDEIQELYEDGTIARPPTPSDTTTGSTMSGGITSNTGAIFDTTDPGSLPSRSNATNGGTTSTDTKNQGDPIDLANGEFGYHNTFMHIPSKGIPYDLTLTYKNQVSYN